MAARAVVRDQEATTEFTTNGRPMIVLLATTTDATQMQNDATASDLGEIKFHSVRRDFDTHAYRRDPPSFAASSAFFAAASPLAAASFMRIFKLPSAVCTATSCSGVRGLPKRER